MHRQEDRYLPHIDGLRAVAVLIVVLFHLDVAGVGGGFVGVDVFLVISGFLITRLIVDELRETGSFAFGRFYLRRVRRLAPALLVTSFVVLGVAALLHSPGVLARTGSEMIASTLSASNVYFWLNADYFAVDQWTRPMLHSWSLSLEEQFYLIWPVTLLLSMRVGGIRAVGFVVAALFVASLLLNPWFADGAPAWLGEELPEAARDGKPTLFFMLPFRVFEFAIGGVLSFAGVARARDVRQGALGAAGLAMIFAAAVAYDEHMVFPSFAALLPCVGAALAIRYGSAGVGALVLGNRCSVWIGQISYSVYLVHWPIISLYYYLDGPPAGAAQLLITAVSLALGHASWRFVETPFRQKHLPLWSMAPLTALLLCAALYCSLSGGWPSRFEPVFRSHGVANATEFHRQEYGGYGFPRGLLGDSERADVLLIGDSHGKQLAEGLLREFLEPEGLGGSMEAGTSLLHLPGVVRTTAGKNWNALRRGQFDRIQKVLRGTAPQPVVVLGQSWITQAARSALLDNEGRITDTRVTPGTVVDRLVALRAELGIKELVVVGQVSPPRHPDLFEALSRPPLSRRVEPASTRSFEVSEATREWNLALAEGAEETGAYTFLDPTEALTEDGRCVAITANDELIYTDSSHLSRAGSRIVVRHFRERLRRLVAAR